MTNGDRTLNSQQRARQRIDEALREGNRNKIEKEAVAKIQAKTIADRLIQKMWPASEPWPLLDSEICILLVTGNPPVLCRANEIESDKLSGELIERWFNLLKIAHQHEDEWQKNKHLRNDANLRALVADRVNHYYTASAIRDLPHIVSDREDSANLALPNEVRNYVLIELNNRLVQACRDEPASASAQLALKIFSALTITRVTTQERVESLQRLKTGRTNEQPFVVRNLKQDSLPKSAHLEPVDTPPQLDDALPLALANLFPQAGWIRRAIKAFLNRDGILEQFLDSDSPIAADVQGAFNALDDHVQLKRDGIFIPKDPAMAHYRRTRYALPDGIACAVCLLALLEWTLHQTVFACSSYPLPAKPKPLGSIRRLAELKLLRPETLNLLQTVYEPDALSLRDAVFHSAFFANDPEKIRRIVHALLNVFERLFADLRTGGKLNAVLNTNRWDNGYTLSPESSKSIIDQHAGSNLLLQFNGDHERKHVFQMLKRLTPDKAPFGRAAIFLWNHVESTFDEEGSYDDYRTFVGLICALIECEEFFRAVLEVYQDTSIVIYSVGDTGAKIDLAYFDPKPGHLLDDKVIGSILPEFLSDADFRTALTAMCDVRNALFHGQWKVLDSDLLEKLHLVVKVLFAMAGAVITKQDREREEWIRENAYYRWLNRNCEPGRELDDWLAAQQAFANLPRDPQFWNEDF